MGNIIFDLVLILASLWIIFDKDTPGTLKSITSVGIILLIISITIRVLIMTGIE